jgi:hypothetical protein
MSTITLRATKGSPLTNTEVDNNFSNLNTDKLESTYAGALNSLTGGSSIVTVSSTTGITTGAWKASVIGAAYGGTGVANGATSTITLGGAVTFTGAYTFGATLTANTSVTFPTSGTLASTSNNLGAFAATTSSQLAGVISDETGSGSLVFATSPTLVTPTLGVATATSLYASAGMVSTGAYAGTYSDGIIVDYVTGNARISAGGGDGFTFYNAADSTRVALLTLSSTGVITTSTWNGATIGVGYGGTGLTSLTSGYIPYGNGTSALSSSSNFIYNGTGLGLGGVSSPTQLLQLHNGNLYFDTANYVMWDVGGNYSITSDASTKLAFASGGAERLRFSAAGAWGLSGANFGTSGQVLTSQGSSSAPVWATSSAATTGKAIAMAIVFGG